MLGIAAVPAGIKIALMITLPESPRWLFRKVHLEYKHLYLVVYV
jgi:SP family myo-inositol transporter-like MFS transporter 13